MQNAEQRAIIHLNNDAKLKTLCKTLKQSKICKTLHYNVIIHLFFKCLMMASPSWLVTVLFCTDYMQTHAFSRRFGLKTLQCSRVQCSTVE